MPVHRRGTQKAGQGKKELVPVKMSCVSEFVPVKTENVHVTKLLIFVDTELTN